MLGHVEWSCRVPHTRLWDVLCTAIVGGSHSTYERGWEKGEKRTKQLALGIERHFLRRARVNERGPRHVHITKLWNSVKCCHDQARRQQPKGSASYVYALHCMRTTPPEESCVAERTRQQARSAESRRCSSLCTAFCVPRPLDFSYCGSVAKRHL